jgi:hypothetical protein
MILRSLVGIFVAALFGLLASTNLARANLITNPGFETGNFDGWIQFGNVGFTGVDAGLPHSGIFAAFLGPVGSLGFLSQTVTTTPGSSYNLSFFLQSDGRFFNQFQVSWNGSLIFDAINISSIGCTPIDPCPTDYTDFGISIVPDRFQNLLATSVTTPLVFGFRNDPGFLHLDDVALEPVPEPTTLILLGTTMAGLALGRRRRQRAIRPAGRG